MNTIRLLHGEALMRLRSNLPVRKSRRHRGGCSCVWWQRVWEGWREVEQTTHGAAAEGDVALAAKLAAVMV